MSKRSKNAQRVFDHLEPICEAAGIELLDVKYAKEGKHMFLRVIVDKMGGIDMDSCAAISEQIDASIDKSLKLTSHDFLEVQSPGIGRPLQTTADFKRYPGQWVLIRVADDAGGSELEGQLGAADETAVELVLEDGTVRTLERGQILSAKRIVKF